MKPGDVCTLSAGRQFQEIVLEDRHGEADRPMVIRAGNGQSAVLDGTAAIRGPWTRHRGSIYKTTLSRDIWQLFVDGKVLTPARWPNAGFLDDAVPETRRPPAGSIWDQKGTWGRSSVRSTPGRMMDAPGAHDLAASGLDATDAVAILNIGSFQTADAPVTEHAPGTAAFTYALAPLAGQLAIQKPEKAFYYLEGKLEFLDAPGEWFYDSGTRQLYVWTRDGTSPQGHEVRGKVQSYAITLKRCSHIEIRGLDFFATTLRTEDSHHITIEDCRFRYPSHSKRMLRKFEPTAVTRLGAVGRHGPERSGNVIRNCTFAYTEGEALIVESHGTVVENCLFHGIDYTCARLSGIGNSIAMHRSRDSVFRRNTVRVCGASETLCAGPRMLVELNRFSQTGYLQNDGAMIHYMQGQAVGSITRFNWLHDSVKLGYRIDGPLDVGNTGEKGRWIDGERQTRAAIYGNVSWNCGTGLMVKGDYHVVAHNTAMGSTAKDISMINILPAGGNRHSVGRNNAAGAMDGFRGSRGRSKYPLPPLCSHNWIGFAVGGDVRDQLRDPGNLDFRPAIKSALIDAGSLQTGLAWQTSGGGPDIGAYESGAPGYWIPGRRLPAASCPIPRDGSKTAKLDADLMWLPGLEATVHEVYFGTDREMVETADVDSPVFRGSQSVNIFSPHCLKFGVTCFWRVDAVGRNGRVRGDVWSFTASAPAVNLIPWPQSLTMGSESMALTGSSRIVYSEASLSSLADVVADEVLEITRLKLAKVQGTGPSAGDIYLKMTADSSITGEAYKVTVASHATAEAKNYNAVAMASVTIIQAIKNNAGSYSIPKMTVKDAPDAGYRGFMVDVARSYHTPKSLKEMIDMCRLYKVRYMQIHFNDDQAYTLPSKAYPQLTKSSRYRYSLAEVTDLVDYADRRGVILIPELETPAHASAMIKAMPELFQSPGGGVVNFADPRVWDALKTIINEACDIFESAPYIHLGADEANIWGLSADPEFKAAIKDHGVGDIEGLFNYYISQLDDAIKARGKKTIVWEGFNYGKTGNAKMDSDVAVMMFDNAKSPQAYIDAGHKVINASWNPMYIVGFDGRGFGCPAHWIFQWDRAQFHGYHNYPMTWKRTKENPLVPSPDVIGGQMCSWEMWEHREIPRLRFRIAPFSDRIWNPGNVNGFAHFEARFSATDVLLDYLLAEHQPPVAPTRVGASDGLYEDKIRVGWADGGNYPRQYALYRNTTSNSETATLVSDIFPKTKTCYEDTRVVMGQTYHYWVKAKNNWGWSGFSKVAAGRTGVRQGAKAYEPFDYAAGASISGQNGGAGFSTAWAHKRNSGPLTVVKDSLSYPGLPVEGGAMKVNHTMNEATELTRYFNGKTCRDMSEVWMSFLVKGDRVALGWLTADLNNGPRIGKQSYNGIGIHYDTSVFMENNVTYFLVLYADCRPGNDTMYLWVNPSTDRAPSIEDYDAIWETSDMPVGNRLRLNLSGTEFGQYMIDEIRVGATWEDAIGDSQLDPDAPTPNPMAWHSEPAAKGRTAATMVCAAAGHPDGVAYFFEEVTGHPGGDDSGWQLGTTYTDTGLQPGYTYIYRVKARNLGAGQNETHWSTTASMVPPNEAFGVNMASDRGPSTMAGESFDGCSNWTDATGVSGTGLAVLGTGGAVTCGWTAKGTWGWGSTDTPEGKLYHGLLDDAGNDSAAVTLKGLKAWLSTIGRSAYTVRVYRNTDTILSFTDVDIISGGSVIDVIPFPDAIHRLPGSGMRAKNDSGILSADTITIDPKPYAWGKSRATISGVQIIAAPGSQ